MKPVLNSTLLATLLFGISATAFALCPTAISAVLDPGGQCNLIGGMAQCTQPRKVSDGSCSGPFTSNQKCYVGQRSFVFKTWVPLTPISCDGGCVNTNFLTTIDALQAWHDGPCETGY